MPIDRTLFNLWVDEPLGGDGSTGTKLSKSRIGTDLLDPIDAALAVSDVYGRLTLSAGVPVTTSDVAGATTVYFTPYMGNSIQLYSGTTWITRTFTETALALGAVTAAIPYDVFGFDSAGALALEKLAWASATARATALTLQDGRLVKSGATTRRYLGTFYTTSTTATEDSAAKRFLWNFYQRKPRALIFHDGTNTWTYTTQTWRKWGGSAAAMVEVVIGWAEIPVTARLQTAYTNSSAGVGAAVGIGYDADTPLAPTAGHLYGRGTSAVANYFTPVHATLVHHPAVGYHSYRALEYSEATGTTTWYGDNGGADIGPYTGLVGYVYG